MEALGGGIWTAVVGDWDRSKIVNENTNTNANMNTNTKTNTNTIKNTNTDTNIYTNELLSSATGTVKKT